MRNKLKKWSKSEGEAEEKPERKGRETGEKLKRNQRETKEKRENLWTLQRSLPLVWAPLLRLLLNERKLCGFQPNFANELDDWPTTIRPDDCFSLALWGISADDCLASFYLVSLIWYYLVRLTNRASSGTVNWTLIYSQNRPEEDAFRS